MALGMIKRIQEDAPNEFSGQVWDIDTWKEFDFSRQAGLTEANRLDVVEYSDQGGVATGLKLKAQVRVTQFLQQPVAVQDAVKNTIKVMVAQNNPIDVIIKKF